MSYICMCVCVFYVVCMCMHEHVYLVLDLIIALYLASKIVNVYIKLWDLVCYTVAS